jgi:hypothetical protein
MRRRLVTQMVKLKHSELMRLNDVVEHIMRATGRTRQQAEHEVLRALKAGELMATGELVTFDRETGREESSGRQSIPAEVWRAFPTEH